MQNFKKMSYFVCGVPWPDKNWFTSINRKKPLHNCETEAESATLTARKFNVEEPMASNQPKALDSPTPFFCRWDWLQGWWHSRWCIHCSQQMCSWWTSQQQQKSKWNHELNWALGCGSKRLCFKVWFALCGGTNGFNCILVLRELTVWIVFSIAPEIHSKNVKFLCQSIEPLMATQNTVLEVWRFSPINLILTQKNAGKIAGKVAIVGHQIKIVKALWSLLQNCIHQLTAKCVLVPGTRRERIIDPSNLVLLCVHNTVTCKTSIAPFFVTWVQCWKQMGFMCLAVNFVNCCGHLHANIILPIWVNLKSDTVHQLDPKESSDASKLWLTLILCKSTIFFVICLQIVWTQCSPIPNDCLRVFSLPWTLNHWQQRRMCSAFADSSTGKCTSHVMCRSFQIAAITFGWMPHSLTNSLAWVLLEILLHESFLSGMLRPKCTELVFVQGSKGAMVKPNSWNWRTAFQLAVRCAPVSSLWGSFWLCATFELSVTWPANSVNLAGHSKFFKTHSLGRWAKCSWVWKCQCVITVKKNLRQPLRQN